MTGDHSTSSIARYTYLTSGPGAAVAPSGPGAGELPSDAIARVNNKAIRVGECTRALLRVAGDKRNEISNRGAHPHSKPVNR